MSSKYSKICHKTPVSFDLSLFGLALMNQSCGWSAKLSVAVHHFSTRSGAGVLQLFVSAVVFSVLPVPSFATNHVARLQRRTQNQQPFQTPATLQTAEQRTAAQEKTGKFLDRLSSQSFSYGALCIFGIAKSPGRCRHDEIFNHDSQLPHRPSNHRRDPTPITTSPRSRKPLGIRTSPVLILP